MSDMSKYFAEIFPVNVSIFVRVKPPEGGGIFLDLGGRETLVMILHPVWGRD